MMSCKRRLLDDAGTAQIVDTPSACCSMRLGDVGDAIHVVVETLASLIWVSLGNACLSLASSAYPSRALMVANG